MLLLLSSARIFDGEHDTLAAEDRTAAAEEEAPGVEVKNLGGAELESPTDQ